MGQQNSRPKISSNDLKSISTSIEKTSIQVDGLHQSYLLQQSQIRAMKRKMDGIARESAMVRDEKKRLKECHLSCNQSFYKNTKIKSNLTREISSSTKTFDLLFRELEMIQFQIATLVEHSQKTVKVEAENETKVEHEYHFEQNFEQNSNSNDNTEQVTRKRPTLHDIRDSKYNLS